MSSRVLLLVCVLLMLDVAAGVMCFDSDKGASIDCTWYGSINCGVVQNSRGCANMCIASAKKSKCNGDEDCCCGTDNCNTKSAKYHAEVAIYVVPFLLALVNY